MSQDYAQLHIDRIRKRLGDKDVLTVADVAAACSLSHTSVLALIDDQELAAVNVGSGKRPFYHIVPESVIGFYRKRFNQD